MTTVGVLGAGQLGRMLALAGYPLGLSVKALDPSDDPPTAPLAEVITAPFDDNEALDRFSTGCDVVTYEFEQVPASSARRVASTVPVHPSPDILEIAQDRLAEKEMFGGLEIPTPRFVRVDAEHTLEDAVRIVGTPAILKTRGGGYDGKGQVVVATPRADAWDDLGRVDCILEERIDFDRELSMIAARTSSGEIAYYPPTENRHADGILRTSIAPAPSLTQDLVDQAESHVRRILEGFDYQGVLAIELFEKDGILYGNEIAPRVHNSGHWTIDGAETSQFENHLRGILGLPLGDPSVRGYAAMVNLIGEVPPTDELLAAGGHVHLYGKSPRPNRKLGHVNVTAGSPEELKERMDMIEKIVQAS